MYSYSWTFIHNPALQSFHGVRAVRWPTHTHTHSLAHARWVWERYRCASSVCRSNSFYLTWSCSYSSIREHQWKTSLWKGSKREKCERKQLLSVSTNFNPKAIPTKEWLFFFWKPLKGRKMLIPSILFFPCGRLPSKIIQKALICFYIEENACKNMLRALTHALCK